ncbi:prephenate/arogenate dehydrogenase [Myxosarcina sp. GI1(2024)]
MKIGIVGLGLIGGSLALDLRSHGHRVVGVSRKERTCQLVLERQIVDLASTNLNIVDETEIAIVCTPIEAIAPTVKHLITILDRRTIITDVGSVKQPVVETCSKLWTNFVGGHPMAGTAESGIEAAQPNLFEGASYVLTPGENTPPEAVEKVKAIALSINAIPYICNARVHDRAVSWISHLPVMVSTSLITSCLSEEPEVLQLAQQLASSGFRDTSRVGGGNPELGVMMAKYNRTELLRSLVRYRGNLDKIITLIEAEDWQGLEQILATNQRARPSFLN